MDSLGRPHRNRLRCPFLAAGSKGKYQKAIAGSRLGKTLLKVRRSDCPDLSRCRSNSGMGRGVYRDLCFTRPRVHVSIYTSIWLGYPNHPYCPVGIAQGKHPLRILVTTEMTAEPTHPQYCVRTCIIQFQVSNARVLRSYRLSRSTLPQSLRSHRSGCAHPSVTCPNT